MRILPRGVGFKRAGAVGDAALLRAHGHVAVALHVHDGAARCVDGDLLVVGTAEAAELGVDVGEVAALQQRVVGEVDAGDDIGGGEGDLLGLGEVVVDVAVEDHPADDAQRQDFFGDELGGVEDVEVEAVGEVFVEELNAELPLREVAGFDGVPEIAAMEVGIGAGDLEGFVPDDRGHAELRAPVELDVGGLAFFVDEAEGVDAEAFHHAEGAGNGAVGHDPHEHVGGFRRERGPVPEGVVRGLRLREAAVRLLLGGVDEVGELDGVLDEEDGDVVADEVPVAFGGVHLDGEAADVAGRVGRAHVAGDGGEADEDGVCWPTLVRTLALEMPASESVSSK